MDASCDAGRDRRHGAAGLLAGAQGALYHRGPGESAGLFPGRHYQRREPPVLAFLKQFDKEIAAANIDSAKTWDDRFVKNAAATLR
jgi:hypothetical protein